MQGADARLIRVAKAAFFPDRPAWIGVAVSGGSDSMASLHLMVQAGWRVRAVTVDHGLRAEAAEEALFVSRACDAVGVAHTTLRWDHGAIAGNVMDAARRARYGLMAGWAQAQGLTHVVLGHTADDQAETFIMGLARAAGIDGLVGMRPHWDQGGVRFVRPFLTHSRAELRGYLTRQGVAWVDDPTNARQEFERVKARQALSVLKPLGITADRLGAVMRHLHDAQAAVERATQEARARLCRTDAGEVIFDLVPFRHEGAEVQRRLLAAALHWVSGAEGSLRGAGLARVREAVAQGKDATLAGCRIRAGVQNFRVVREPRAVAAVGCATDQLWDGRWRLDGPQGADLRVGALGVQGLARCKGWRDTGHSRDALLVSPAVWRGDALIAAPLAGFGTGWTARIDAGFGLFAVSH